MTATEVRARWGPARPGCFMRVGIITRGINVFPCWEGSTTVPGSLHCRLAKFRGLMYRVKYGAVIGREMRIFVLLCA